MKQWWLVHHWPVLGLSAIYWLLTIPFMSRLPYNWDAAQFVLALRNYDIGMHQPHPPGYPLFVVLGKLLDLFFSENSALVIIAAVFGYVSVMMFYLFCYRLWSHRLGSSVIAIAWILNPLFWLYRETALTYTVDAAASITVGYLVWQTMTVRTRLYVLLSSGVLAVAGAIRPSLVVLLLPLFIFQLSFHRRNWKLVLVSFGILIVGTLAWLLPVMWLTGGIGEYITHSRNLYSASATNSNILEQTKLVFNTLLISLNLLSIPMVASVVLLAIRYTHYWQRFITIYIFAAVWIVPALLIYSFGHFGQLGYALILIPPFYLLLIPIVQLAIDRWLGRWLMLICLVLVSLIFLVLAPGYAHPNFFPKTRAELYLQHLARWSPNLFKLNAASIRESDAKLTAFVQAIQQYPAEQTLIIAGRDILYPSPANGLLIRNDEVFRELSALVSDYHSIEVAPGRDYYLTAQFNQMEAVYQSTITLPNEVKYIVFALDVLPDNQPGDILTTASTGYHLGVMDRPWTLLGFTFRRANDTIVTP
ncbi:MAG: hypothetical protein ACD_41C00053G0003 [uncultured bacterium]|nr:MAG: hypothetical protein ACD_41C00053G0003 [uncultured bacterium]HBY73369.1 hypothetical protein [Candidatus Kerfeldbacteria bacterium]